MKFRTKGLRPFHVQSGKLYSALATGDIIDKVG